MNFPARFYTGVRNTTIPNPAWLHNSPGGLSHRRPGTDFTTFEGLCSEYNFRLQMENYIKLRNVLRSFGTDFLYVAAASYTGDVKNHRFVACSADGSLVWNKYVAYVAQGGQNHVYVAGRRIKVSVFLVLSHEQQMALLGGNEAKIQKAFVKPQKTAWGENYTLKVINEDKELWN